MVSLSAPRIFLLGNLSVVSLASDSAGAIVAQPKRFALLAYLALARPRGWLRRDAIVACFWPDSTQERARRALRDALYVLRRELGEDWIEGRGSEEVRLGPHVAVDAIDFEEAIAAGELAAALTLYRGELLPAFHLSDVPEFGAWLDIERARLQRMALTAARTLRDAPGAVELAERVYYAERAVECGMSEPSDVARFTALVTASTTTATAAPELLAGAPVASADPPLPTSEPEVAVPRGRRGAWRALVGVTAVMLLVWLGWRPRPNTFEGTSSGSIPMLVLPFAVHGGAGVQYLGEGMMDLLAAKMDGVAGFQVVDPQTLHSAFLDAEGPPRDVATASRLATRFGGAHFVMGSVVEVGGRLQLSAYLYDGGGRELARAEGLAPVDELLEVLDDVARELLAGHLTGPDAELSHGAALTTRSLPALREFLVGEQAMRQGEFAAAYEAYSRATALDTTFALAYYRLSSAADWLGRAEDAHAAIRQAARYRDRLSGTDRLFLQAREDLWLGDASEAERGYRRLVTLRPTSAEAWYESAEVLFHGGPWMGRSMLEAIPAFRQVLTLMPTHASAMLHLARLAALQGDARLVDSLTRVLAAQEPGHARLAEMHLLQAGLATGEPRVQKAREALDAVDVISRVMAVDRMSVYTGDREAALLLARPLTDPAVPAFPRRAAMEITSHLAAGLGVWALSDSMLDRLALLDPLRAAQARALAVLGAADRTDSTRTRAALRALRATPARANLMRTDSDLRTFAVVREQFFLGALAERLGDTSAVAQAIRSLDSVSAGNADEPVYARHLSGLLRALVAQSRGEPGVGLAALEASWPPPRRTIMVRWAWHHTTVLSRVVRAELLLALNRPEEAKRWATAAVEDIAGTPLLQSRIDRIR